MYVARRCPEPYVLDRMFGGMLVNPYKPPESWLEQFRASIREALTAMGVWLP